MGPPVEDEAGVLIEETSSKRTPSVVSPSVTRAQPKVPASIASASSPSSSTPRRGASSCAETGARRPARAATANATPSGRPTHQVATTPQYRATNVGSCPATSEWPTVKYSRHTRAVI